MTPEQRKSYAQALSGQKSGVTWTNIPPARTGRQVEGASILPLGRYEMPDGSHQVSWGLPQGALDAYRSMRYGLGFEQDPDAPAGYVSEDAISRGAFGAAGMAATGGIAATTAARAAGRPMVPRNSISANGASSNNSSVRAYHGTSHDFDKFNSSEAQGMGHRHVLDYDNPAPPSMFFSKRKGVANHFSDVDNTKRLSDPRSRVIPVDIDTSNVFDFRNPVHRKEMMDLIDLEFAHAPNSWEKKRAIELLDEGNWYFFDTALRQRWLGTKGYDGWVEKQTFDPEDITYAMFNKGKVKGAYTGDTLWSSGIPGLHATEDDY